jgi:hypothetical protein
MAYYNMGCLVISNATPDAFFVIDGERSGVTLSIPPNGSANFNSVLFPWCYNTIDIAVKAFRFFRAGAGAFYMFATDSGYSGPLWTPYNGGKPSFEQRITAGERGSYVDIFINADGTPSTVRSGQL